jgi:hypothetical protein
MLVTAQRLQPEHEAQLIRDVEELRNALLADREDTYGPVAARDMSRPFLGRRLASVRWT